jgi:hypothetical protein
MIFGGIFHKDYNKTFIANVIQRLEQTGENSWFVHTESKDYPNLGPDSLRPLCNMQGIYVKKEKRILLFGGNYLRNIILGGAS